MITTTPTGKLFFSIFASLSEFEKDTIRQRQAEGIAIAKANGIYICKKLCISISTLDRRIIEYEETLGKTI